MIPSSSPSSDQPTVAVAGGGLAGLAAACALADAGFRVTLFEKRPFLGGRASSYEHPGTGEVVDNCQHVLLGCCTNLVEFYRRTGVEENIRWYDKLVFLEPGGRASFIAPSFLPAPLHTAPSFLRAACLGWRDKLAIARAMMILAGVFPDGGSEPFLARVRGETRGIPVFRDTGENFLVWLRRQHQTEQAIERFWKTILVSALNEDLDRVSVPYAAQVVRESFLKSAAGGRMGVPTVPLTDLYDAAGAYIRARGGELRLRTSLAYLTPSESRVTVRNMTKVDYREGQTADIFDYFISALPFDALDRILIDTPDSAPLRETIAHFESSPITGIHLWFDRQISDLDHAVLLDRTIQWMFHKSRLQPMRTRPAEFPLLAKEARSGAPTDVGSYIELVVSSSKTLIDKSRSEIVDLALRELREFFPAAREAKLVKSTVIKEVNATYSPRPGMDAHRPGATTAWPRVFLAGDWTATGWPATMEGAVRSGYLAAEALARAAGRNDARFLSPDLPATGLMRMFA
ncbi:Carotene 7,8-desaturase [Candidatus Sulfotelmatobacter kueseliae]|uniref:Carotene 7,8-desaturase n=1 Tax=Candidatus Sulfotelmatobacter kueseliae TaxID=2042962 RepID=A0A2U3K952_9BACT|nr:Carotene 7,8-desaturase [Candidatus Sulfotelmatobacter kueseliae]